MLVAEADQAEGTQDARRDGLIHVAGPRAPPGTAPITVPRVADGYYGLNEAFLAHLQQNSPSWETVYLEAIGNDLEVSTAGGELIQRYPIVVAAAEPEVEASIKGGVGAVPIRSEGLQSTTGYALHGLTGHRRIPLDQPVHGNDFWQADYDAEPCTYKMSVNLPLDGVEETTWLLTQRQQ